MSEPTSTNRALIWTLRGGAAALLATSALFGALAWDARSDFENTTYQRQASEASDRYRLDTTLAFDLCDVRAGVRGGVLLRRVCANDGAWR